MLTCLLWNVAGRYSNSSQSAAIAASTIAVLFSAQQQKQISYHDRFSASSAMKGRRAALKQKLLQMKLYQIIFMNSVTHPDDVH